MNAPGGPVSPLLKIRKTTMRTMFAAATFMLAACAGVQAQQQIEWKQVLNTPKAVSLPSESGSMLGVELGDTYAEAKTKLEVLAAEGVRQRPKGAPLLKEETNTFRIPIQGASTVMTASYVSKVILERELAGKTPRNYDDTLSLTMSAPSSGHQVIGMVRVLSYNTETDQPRVSEIIGQLNQKMKSVPLQRNESTQSHYLYQFDDGKPAPARVRPIAECQYWHGVASFENVRQINPQGNCDAVLSVKISHGISTDHAKYIEFILSDNDRTKANLTADFTFVRDFVRVLQERVRGTAPRL